MAKRTRSRTRQKRTFSRKRKESPVHVARKGSDETPIKPKRKKSKQKKSKSKMKGFRQSSAFENLAKTLVQQKLAQTIARRTGLNQSAIGDRLSYVGDQFENIRDAVGKFLDRLPSALIPAIAILALIAFALYATGNLPDGAKEKVQEWTTPPPPEPPKNGEAGAQPTGQPANDPGYLGSFVNYVKSLFVAAPADGGQAAAAPAAPAAAAPAAAAAGPAAPQS